MRKLLTVGILSAAILFPHTVNAQVSDSETCVVYDETLSGGDCRDWYQSQADAAWEGLDSSQQNEIGAIGLQGTEFDKYVIRVRDGQIQEDEAGWECHSMGNRVCGPTPTPMTELPHTM